MSKAAELVWGMTFIRVSDTILCWGHTFSFVKIHNLTKILSEAVFVSCVNHWNFDRVIRMSQSVGGGSSFWEQHPQMMEDLTELHGGCNFVNGLEEKWHLKYISCSSWERRQKQGGKESKCTAFKSDADEWFKSLLVLQKLNA